MIKIQQKAIVKHIQ